GRFVHVHLDEQFWSFLFRFFKILYAVQSEQPDQVRGIPFRQGLHPPAQCGGRETKRCLPASMFSSEDLPTFERPIKANSGSDSSGHESKSGALQSKMADAMFTMENPHLCRTNPAH